MLDHFLFGRVQRALARSAGPDRRVRPRRLPSRRRRQRRHESRGARGAACRSSAWWATTRPRSAADRLGVGGVDAVGPGHRRHRPTTRKLRIVTERNQQVARIDYETDADLDEAVAARVAAAIDAHRRGRGRPARVRLSEGLHHGRHDGGRPDAATPRGIAAARRSRRFRTSICYRGATLVTPNHHEAETATHARIRNDDEARDAARRLPRAAAAAKSVLITRGEQACGCSMARTTPATEANFAAIAREVSDVTGAGDTVIAHAGPRARGGRDARRSRAARQPRRRRRGRAGSGRSTVDARRADGTALDVIARIVGMSPRHQPSAQAASVRDGNRASCNCSNSSVAQCLKCRRPVNTMAMPVLVGGGDHFLIAH